jgi:hypothetical protein
MPNNYVLLDRIELNATTASVTFDNIPQTGYTDLKIVASTRQSGAAITASINLNLNGSSTGFTYKALQGAGSGTPSSFSGSTGYLGQGDASTATANTFGNAEFYIPNYTSSNYKSISSDTVDETNATTTYAQMNAVFWSNTAAITSASIVAGNGNFVQYSTFSLYGLAAVGTTPAIAPKADGGNVIATDGTYWYHAFLSNGTFTPQVGLNADVLVVAGGGGGGQQSGGGGGAGGLLAFTSQGLTTSTNYTCTIGSGGAGSTTTAAGTTGSDSQFGALTLVKGGGGGGTQGGTNAGSTGGSGGGGSYSSGAGGSATSGQGNNGGSGSATAGQGGGGGGASAAGGNGSTGGTGTGGAGTNSYSSWLSPVALGASGYLAGGGGAGSNGGSGNAAGGSGGGGTGANTTVSATSGTINTGGGGGGGCDVGTRPTGGTGGSGIIIIRYLVA